MKVAKIGLGRYGESSWLDFLRKLALVQRETRAPVPTELVVQEIRQSLREDLKPGVKPHESGNDVKSLATERIDDLQSQIISERRAQETNAVTQEINLLTAMLADRQKRLKELSGEAAGGLNARQLELEQVKAEIERKKSVKKSDNLTFMPERIRQVKDSMEAEAVAAASRLPARIDVRA